MKTKPMGPGRRSLQTTFTWIAHCDAVSMRTVLGADDQDGAESMMLVEACLHWLLLHDAVQMFAATHAGDVQ